MEENILNKIKTKLEELNIPVCYGIAKKKDVQDAEEFIVFGRVGININQQITARTRRFEVVIVSKDWVSDELIADVVAKAKEAGLKVSNNTDAEISYQTKNDTAYELVSIPFIKLERVDF